jgi:hypothetical protein
MALFQHSINLTLRTQDTTKQDSYELMNDCFSAASRALSSVPMGCSSNKYYPYLIAMTIGAISARNESFPKSALDIISQGLHVILDKCAQKHKKKIYYMLNNDGRNLFDEIHSNYLTDYKFTGKS